MSQWVRNRVAEFVAKQRRHPARWRVLAEGDSWFSYPAGFWKGRKLITHLRQQHELPLNILSLANPGDTLYKMAFGESGELDLALDLVREAGQTIDLVLLSAGGNDLFRRIQDLVPLRHAPFIDAGVLAQLMTDFAAWYAALVARIRKRLRKAPIVVHGYDYVFPTTGARRILGVFPVGPWLGRHFKQLGLTEPEQHKVARALVDAFNDALLARLDAIVHLDLRGTLVDPADFADEIHPSPAGMEKLVAKFVAAIGGAVS